MKKNNQQFQYMMLGRLVSDCEYYLGNGGRNPKNLWALEEKEHISEMKKIYNQLEVKPEWLSMEDIKEYESKMTQ